MARPNRTGVPGLVKLATGPNAGRYRLGFRYVDKLTHKPARLSKLYARGLSLAAIKADARRLVNDALSGALSERQAAAAEAKGQTIAELAPEVIRLREQDGGSPGTLHEFRSIVASIERPGRKPKGGHIVRHIGNLEPHELDSEKLAGFADALKKDGLSPLTIRNVFKVLSQFIRIVRVRKLDARLVGNPVRDAFEVGLALPSKRREAPIFLAQVDAEKLLACAAIPEDRRTRYALAFLSGLRDGEISALTWGDVEMDAAGAELVHVTKAVAKIGGLQDTKTAASVRDVPLHPELVPWLRVWRAEGWRLVVGREPKPEDPVFPRPPAVPGPTGAARAYRPDSARLIRRDLTTAGVVAPKGIDFHATRRSFASWLEAAGVPHETIERLVGHEPKSVLGRHYAAADLGVLREAVSRLRLTKGSRLRVVA